MKKVFMLIAAFAVVPALPAVAASECKDNCVKRMTTDFSGKPPYKRSFEMVPASQVEAEKAAKLEKAKFRGKPPYKNRLRARGR